MKTKELKRIIFTKYLRTTFSILTLFTALMVNSSCDNNDDDNTVPATTTSGSTTSSTTSGTTASTTSGTTSGSTTSGTTSSTTSGTTSGSTTSGTTSSTTSSTTSGTTSATTAATTSSTTSTPQNQSVSIIDLAFSPATITVSSGTTVVWTNNGATIHTVTSNSGQFDSGNLNPGATYQFTFTTPGTYSYHCTIHPQMVGTVTVQ